MKKFLLISTVILVCLVGSFYTLNNYTYNEKQADVVSKADYKDAEFIIDDESVQLSDGFAEVEAAPGSASKIIYRYFGNELRTDLNGDGLEDVAFVLVQETDGSGTFYFAVGAVATETGFKGSDGYLLGDRIAPQTTEISPNPRHRHVVVFNYADRKMNEPMTKSPSVGKSIYLKLVPETMQWAVVEPDFEGEAS